MSCDLDGQNPISILGSIPELVHPFAVAVHKELMYWDDWNKKAIYFANKNSGKGLTVLRKDMNGAMDMKIFSPLQRSGTNACSDNPCSHLCVPMPSAPKFRCLCPDGMKAESEGGNQCVCPDHSLPNANGTCKQSSGTCSEDQFTCSNGLCVPQKWKCDGDDDCGGKAESS
jgi:hypothetical protein